VALLRRSFADGTARRAREDAGLSLRDVAPAAGITLSTLSRWERGLRRPRAAECLRAAPVLAELLEVASTISQEAR